MDKKSLVMLATRPDLVSALNDLQETLHLNYANFSRSCVSELLDQLFVLFDELAALDILTDAPSPLASDADWHFHRMVHRMEQIMKQILAERFRVAQVGARVVAHIEVLQAAAKAIGFNVAARLRLQNGFAQRPIPSIMTGEQMMSMLTLGKELMKGLKGPQQRAAAFTTP